ncbi:hypothetical protein AMTRI_Chr02g215000 [Amborella trichopoda]|uniref:Uncharacterized protein n=1 Tax=Amborella trichopoda TaxID=13333 RepID=U5DAX7_AMBTC|nr:uncharacterized protein LOC18448068 [Amborella trichopoda]ERN19674.1 hypothetical protein AMTR_s00062p00178830 [Amborella trichopoda]|eukprot:XP_011628472.1 uncharacterized protein LOC18448068 [Amborella trichopoda]
MGNCVRKSSSWEGWEDEEWGCDEAEKLVLKPKVEREEEVLSKKKNGGDSKEVKIRISKKQLEELLGKMELHGMSVDQMIEQLMNTNGHKHRGWRPVLQSIPECESWNVGMREKDNCEVADF